MTLLDRVCVLLDAAQIPHALIGAAALVFGILAIALALHLRKFSGEHGTPSRLPA